MSAEEVPLGEFTVQPVCRAVPCTTLPPIVVRTGDYTPGADAVVGMCVLLDQDGNNTIQDVMGENGNVLESIFDTNHAAGLQCHASAPIADSKLSSRSSSSGSGGSSSSSSAGGGQKSNYFAFTSVGITWAGTYRIGVYIWVYPTHVNRKEPAPEPYIAVQLISEQIEIIDGQNPDERPTKEEKRILNRMRHTTGMAHFNIPHQ
ncbi:hypothetical protein MCOR25_009753 [Pyricularia grisea]|nr:hypothetical protein MCOR25_009753 [Pyricularia grisea]